MYKEGIDSNFFRKFGIILTEEQINRFSRHILIQLKMVRISDNIFVYNAIHYILQNDYNWIISISRLTDNIYFYRWLIKDLSSLSDSQINEEIVQLFLEVISDKHNYFEIDSYSDLVNFQNKKNAICLDILNGNLNDIPLKLNEITPRSKLYKFALLEYKFGISLDDAEVLVKRYGKDVEELPEGIFKNYLQLLKEIVECNNIKDVIAYAIENDMLQNPWDGFPTSREAEGKILDLFADLYNETLYKPKEEDKEESESYIDSNGNEHEIEVYKIKEDFRMCVRSEGVAVEFNEFYYNQNGKKIDFKEYYNRRSIENHGNSESYFGNEHLGAAETENIMVGYEKIYKNQLAGASPKVRTNLVQQGILTVNNGSKFSIFGDNSIELRTPNRMIDNTRVTGTIQGYKYLINFNEIYKDRFIVNENGEIEQYKPSYIVYIDESTEEERKNPNWKEKRKEQKKWLLTKQAAAELGVPIVIIDREYFAKREMQKVELMKQLIAGEQIDEEEYGKYLKNYQGLSKPAIIKRLFTTIENNRTGMINNLKFRKRFFTQEFCQNIRIAVFNAIENMNEKDALECLNALIEVAKKELSMKVEVDEVWDMGTFYRDIIDLSKNRIRSLKTINNDEASTTSGKNIDLLKMYLKYGVSKDDLTSSPINTSEIRKSEGVFRNN